MKLSVTTNIPIAITLPTMDALGAHGLTAISAAVASSTTPSTAEKVVTEGVVRRDDLALETR